MRSEVFYDNLVAVEIRIPEIVLNKPIYTGFSVLDLSKLLMQDFHYQKMNGLRQTFDVKLLFTDTDTLCYDMIGKHLHGELKTYSHHFDLSITLKPTRTSVRQTRK